MDDGVLWLVMFGLFLLTIGLIAGWAELCQAVERRRSTARPLPGNEPLTPLPGLAISGNGVDASAGNAPATSVNEEIDPVKLDILIRLLNAGVVKQTEGIETIFECKRSGRPDSLYNRVRAALPQPGPQYPPRTPEQVATRQALGLE